MQQEDDLPGLAKVMDFMRALSILFVVINIYWYCYQQIAAVIKPALSMCRFQTMGEFRALLSLYNIGIEEIRGERNGQAYQGLLYTALNTDGGKAEVTPLKSSLFGKSAGFDALERHMEHSGEKITKENSREQTRHRVAEAFLDAPPRTSYANCFGLTTSTSLSGVTIRGASRE